MSADAPKPPLTGVDAAAERIRTTAQWMVVTFGGIAGALLVGLQLTGLHDTKGDDRTIALIGYAIGVGGALLAVLAAAVTLTAGRTTFQSLAGTGGKLSLRRYLNRLVDLRAGFDSIEQFVAKIDELIRQRTQTFLAWRAAESAVEANDDDALAENLKASAARAERAHEHVNFDADQLMPAAARLLRVANFHDLRRTWDVCRLLIVAFAAVAAAGLALFSVHVGDSAEPALDQSPVMGMATLTVRSWRIHQAELGDACDRHRIAVVVTAADEKSYSLTVMPSRENPCGPALITLPRRQGSVRSHAPVALAP